MANRTVTVRYILDASGYRSGANDIKSADASVAASARASAAAMDQQQAKVSRAQANATKSYVAGGKAQAEAVTKVGRASAASVRIIEDAERRKVRVQEDATRRVQRVQQDAAQRMARTTNEQVRQQIAQSASLRAARLREDAATRASRIGEDAGVRANRSGDGEVASLQQKATAYSQVGRSALIAGGLIGAGLTLSARAAVQWQSDFTGVARVVGGSTESLNGLSDQLRGLSRELPESSTEIANVATNAAQLGIKTPNIAAFTKTMVELGDTTNLSSEEASTSLAQLGNIMGTLNGPAEQVNDTIQRTGSTIVGLGQSGASTEQQITDMGLRIASAGRSIGLNTTQVLGFASAVANTGVQAELGGTAISTGFLKIDEAVRGGGKGLDALAKTAGLTSQQFKDLYSTDSGSALTQFIEGLGRVSKEGGDSNAILRTLGITGARAGQVFRNLALSGDNVRNSLSNAAKSAADNTALTQAATARYETDASRIRIAVNKIKDDAIDIGGAALPVISAVTDKVGKYADAYKKLSPETQSGLVKTAGVSAGVLLVGGAALSAAGSVATLASNLKALGATRGTITGLAGSLGSFGAVAAAAVIGFTAAEKGVAAVQANSKLDSHLTTTLADAGQAISIAGKNASQAVPALDSFFKVTTTTDLNPFTGKINGLGDAFKTLNPQNGDKVFSALTRGLHLLGGPAGSFDITTQRVDQLDTKLAELATSGGGKQAAAAFAAIVPQARAAGETSEKISSQFDDYSKAVTSATEANGYHIKSQDELVDIMAGKMPPALTAAAKNNTDLAKAVNAVTGANIGQTKTLAEQLAGYQKNAAGILGLRQGQAGVESAIDTANAALKQNGRTLDVNTDKGRQNRTALDNIAVATSNYTGQLVKQHSSAVKVVEANERGKQAFISQARSFGLSAKAAKALAGELFKIPKSYKADVVVDVKGSGSKKQIHDLNEDIHKLPKEQRAKIVTIAEEKGIKAARSAIKDLTAKPKTAKVKTEYDKGKPPVPKPIKQKILQQFSTETPPKIPDGKQTIRRVFSGENDVGGALDSKKSRTITFNSKVNGPKAAPTPKGGTIKYKSEVTPPKPPKAPKGATINYKSKAEAPKAPKAPKGATITFKVKVDKVSKIAVPKGGTVKIKTDVDLSGVQRAKAGVSSVKGRTVTVKTAAGLGGVNAVRGAIAGLPSSKTVTITTIRRDVTETVKRAGGGKVRGPGTATSDSIPAMLSDEEWVIRTASGRYYGDPIMAALNAGTVPRSVLAPFAYATGGKAGQTPQRLASGGKADPSSLASIMQFVGQPADFFADIKNAARDASKALRNVGKAERQVAKAQKELRDADTPKERKKALADLKRANKALEGVQKKYKDQLQAVTDAQKAAAEQIRSYADGLTKNYRSASTSGADVLSLQQQGATDLKALQAKVDQLQKLGLNDSEIARIVGRAQEGDVAGASALADSILSGGKGLVDQLNKANKALEQIADALAADVSTKRVRGLATGGQVSGPGTGTSDSVPIMASNREWIHPTKSVDYYGEAFMAAVQNRTLPRSRIYGHMANGGQVGVKVVTAPSSTADFVQAMQGMTVQVQNPWTGQYMDAHMRVVADQQIGSAINTAAGSR